MCVATLAFGQKSAQVRELENQRQAALQGIEMTNKLLAQTNQSAQSSLDRLNLLTEQIRQRKQVIDLLNREVAQLDKEMDASKARIAGLEGDLKDKRDQYAQSLRQMQKHHDVQDKLLFIFSADNFAQSLRRMRYLQEYADWQKKQAGDIVNKQKALRDQWDALQKSRVDKQKLLASRESEYEQLETAEAVQRMEVQTLNRKQRQLQDELKKKQRQARDLEKQIQRQIADEVAQAAKEAQAARERAAANQGKADNTRVAESKGGYAMTKAEKALSDNFAANYGRLPAPVNAGYTVVSAFGEQQHPELKYVRLLNNGIDLQTSAGAEARAVFNGVVSAVFVEPTYSVIVRHGNYLTVYSNLS
ncbi:MAG: peptidase M24, partial [Tannerella sp.]|nr:peptidase M24 [Tannerella sp.]